MSMDNWTIIGVIAGIGSTLAAIIGIYQNSQKKHVEKKTSSFSITNNITKDSLPERKYGINGNKVDGSVSNNIVSNGGINNNTVKGGISNNNINGDISNNKS